MTEIKWIKITTDMFDNRKIKHLRKLPEGNNILLIWVMLLTIAGRCNLDGMIFLTEDIPYTPKMLADELGFEENTVILAIKFLQQLNMISTTENGYLIIVGWEEYQNIDGMDKIREQNRIRKQKQRARRREKQLPEKTDTSRDSHGTVTQCHATDIDKDKDIDIDKEKKNENNISPSPEKNQNKPVKHKYGEYSNVLLTDEEREKLKREYPDYEKRIDRLSGYIEATGKSYKSHYATIRNWAKKEQENEEKNNRQNQTQQHGGTYL